jgi:hypothetical protein
MAAESILSWRDKSDLANSGCYGNLVAVLLGARNAQPPSTPASSDLCIPGAAITNRGSFRPNRPHANAV